MTQIRSEVAQSCPTLWSPMGGSLPGSFIHGIFQARILECCQGSLVYLNRGQYLGCKIWALVLLFATGQSLLVGPFSGQNQKISMRTHTSLYLFLNTSIHTAENHEAGYPVIFNPNPIPHGLFQPFFFLVFLPFLSYSQNPGSHHLPWIYLLAVLPCVVPSPSQTSCLFSPGPTDPTQAGVSLARVPQACAGSQSAPSLFPPRGPSLSYLPPTSSSVQ